MCVCVSRVVLECLVLCSSYHILCRQSHQWHTSVRDYLPQQHSIRPGHIYKHPVSMDAKLHTERKLEVKLVDLYMCLSPSLTHSFTPSLPSSLPPS